MVLIPATPIRRIPEPTETTMKLAHFTDRKKTPDLHEYRPLTRDEVLALKAGQTVEFIRNDGKVGSIKINGAVRTWKRDPNRVEVPVKYGMYEYATFDLDEAMRRMVKRVEAPLFRPAIGAIADFLERG